MSEACQEVDPVRGGRRAGGRGSRGAVTGLDSTRSRDGASVAVCKHAERHSCRPYSLRHLEQLSARRPRLCSRRCRLDARAAEGQHHIHEARDAIESADLVLVPGVISSKVEEETRCCVDETLVACRLAQLKEGDGRPHATRGANPFLASGIVPDHRDQPR